MNNTNDVIELSHDDLEVIEGGACYVATRQCFTDWVNEIGFAALFALAFEL